MPEIEKRLINVFSLSYIRYLGSLIHPAVWPEQTWAEKRGLLCPFPWGGAGSPCNTMSPALSSSSNRYKWHR